MCASTPTIARTVGILFTLGFRIEGWVLLGILLRTLLIIILTRRWRRWAIILKFKKLLSTVTPVDVKLDSRESSYYTLLVVTMKEHHTNGFISYDFHSKTSISENRCSSSSDCNTYKYSAVTLFRSNFF